MNGISTLVVTFIIFIAAKGELGKYADLVRISNRSNTGSSPTGGGFPSTKPVGLPELPKLPTLGNK